MLGLDHGRKHIGLPGQSKPLRAGMFHFRRFTLRDPAVKDDFDGLAKLNDGDFSVANRTEADDIWLVGYQSDRAPGRFYRWDRKAKQGTFLFTTRPKLDGLALAEMKAVGAQDAR